jgi:hypothetical protein
MFAAFAALAWVLLFPSIPAIATLGVFLTAGFTAAAWPCREPRADLMAIADATREDPAPVFIPSYVPAEWTERYRP